MWIAVCEDDPAALEELQEFLMNAAGDDDMITCFRSGLDLIDAVERAGHPVDLLLLDIEMPGLDGITAGLELRAICPDTYILITTNYLQYAYDSYQIRAENYLLKPLQLDQLKNEIEKIRLKVMSGKRKVFHLKTKKSSLFLSHVDILYIESKLRTLYICTRTNRYPYHKSLKQLLTELNDDAFEKIHKSYAVNLSHVKAVRYGGKTGNQVWAELSCGKQLPVGQRNVEKVILALLELRGING